MYLYSASLCSYRHRLQLWMDARRFQSFSPFLSTQFFVIYLLCSEALILLVLIFLCLLFFKCYHATESKIPRRLWMNAIQLGFAWLLYTWPKYLSREKDVSDLGHTTIYLAVPLSTSLPYLETIWDKGILKTGMVSGFNGVWSKKPFLKLVFELGPALFTTSPR